MQREIQSSKQFACPCKEYVTGQTCNQCKKGYYSLGSDIDRGCLTCTCNLNGTLNELDLCDQKTGQCECKHFSESKFCDECSAGFYSLKRNDIFGCEPCDCQIGTSEDNFCDRITGECSCKPNFIGRRCDQVEVGFYVPDLHQLKFELENGKVEGEVVNYGFDSELFRKFSWIGYAHLNKNDGEVVVDDVNLENPGNYRLVVRYLNNNLNVTSIKVKVWETNSDAQPHTGVLVSKIDKLIRVNNSIISNIKK